MCCTSCNSTPGSWPTAPPLATAFLSWEGETHIEPPREARAQQGVLDLGDYWCAERLRDPRPRLVRPDAVLEIARTNGDGAHVFLIEYDRTRRVDKNYEKFRRYDTFLCWWWQHTSFADRGRPYVLFVCQDDDQRDRFLGAADRELTGRLWHPSTSADDDVYIGRQRLLFASEVDAHAGNLEARRAPKLPAGEEQDGVGDGERKVRLPGRSHQVERARGATRVRKSSPEAAGIWRYDFQAGAW